MNLIGRNRDALRLTTGLRVRILEMVVQIDVVLTREQLQRVEAIACDWGTTADTLRPCSIDSVRRGDGG